MFKPETAIKRFESQIYNKCQLILKMFLCYFYNCFLQPMYYVLIRFFLYCFAYFHLQILVHYINLYLYFLNIFLLFFYENLKLFCFVKNRKILFYSQLFYNAENRSVLQESIHLTDHFNARQSTGTFPPFLDSFLCCFSFTFIS